LRFSQPLYRLGDLKKLPFFFFSSCYFFFFFSGTIKTFRLLRPVCFPLSLVAPPLSLEPVCRLRPSKTPQFFSLPFFGLLRLKTPLRRLNPPFGQLPPSLPSGIFFFPSRGSFLQFFIGFFSKASPLGVDASFCPGKLFSEATLTPLSGSAPQPTATVQNGLPSPPFLFFFLYLDRIRRACVFPPQVPLFVSPRPPLF